MLFHTNITNSKTHSHQTYLDGSHLHFAYPVQSFPVKGAIACNELHYLQVSFGKCRLKCKFLEFQHGRTRRADKASGFSKAFLSCWKYYIPECGQQNTRGLTIAYVEGSETLKYGSKSSYIRKCWTTVELFWVSRQCLPESYTPTHYLKLWQHRFKEQPILPFNLPV